MNDVLDNKIALKYQEPSLTHIQISTCKYLISTCLLEGHVTLAEVLTDAIPRILRYKKHLPRKYLLQLYCNYC